MGELENIHSSDLEQFEPVATSWESVTKWDDVVPPEEKRVVRDIEKFAAIDPCPFLKKDGNFFFYCEAAAKRLRETEPQEGLEYTPADARYCSKIDLAVLQLWCRGGIRQYKNCSQFTESGE